MDIHSHFALNPLYLCVRFDNTKFVVVVFFISLKKKRNEIEKSESSIYGLHHSKPYQSLKNNWFTNNYKYLI